MFECTHKIIKLCFRIYLQSLSLNFFKLYRKYNAQDLLNIFIHFCLEDIRGDWDILCLFDKENVNRNGGGGRELLSINSEKYKIQRSVLGKDIMPNVTLLTSNLLIFSIHIIGKQCNN